VKGLEGDLLAFPGKHRYDVMDGFLDAESPLCSEILKRMGIG
jgi:arylformamidase